MNINKEKGTGGNTFASILKSLMVPEGGEASTSKQQKTTTSNGDGDTSTAGRGAAGGGNDRHHGGDDDGVVVSSSSASKAQEEGEHSDTILLTEEQDDDLSSPVLLLPNNKSSAPALVTPPAPSSSTSSTTPRSFVIDDAPPTTITGGSSSTIEELDGEEQEEEEMKEKMLRKKFLEMEKEIERETKEAKERMKYQKKYQRRGTNEDSSPAFEEEEESDEEEDLVATAEMMMDQIDNHEEEDVEDHEGEDSSSYSYRQNRHDLDIDTGNGKSNAADVTGDYISSYNDDAGNTIIDHEEAMYQKAAAEEKRPDHIGSAAPDGVQSSSITMLDHGEYHTNDPLPQSSSYKQNINTATAIITNSADTTTTTSSSIHDDIMEPTQLTTGPILREILRQEEERQALLRQMQLDQILIRPPPPPPTIDPVLSYDDILLENSMLQQALLLRNQHTDYQRRLLQQQHQQQEIENGLLRRIRTENILRSIAETSAVAAASAAASSAVATSAAAAATSAAVATSSSRIPTILESLLLDRPSASAVVGATSSVPHQATLLESILLERQQAAAADAISANNVILSKSLEIRVEELLKFKKLYGNYDVPLGIRAHEFEGLGEWIEAMKQPGSKAYDILVELEVIEREKSDTNKKKRTLLEGGQMTSSSKKLKTDKTLPQHHHVNLRGTTNESEISKVGSTDKHDKKTKTMKDLGAIKSEISVTKQALDVDSGAIQSEIRNTKLEKITSESLNSALNLNRGPFSFQFKKRFNQLIAYRNTHGNIDIPYNHADDPEFGLWFHSQKKSYSLYKRGGYGGMREAKRKLFQEYNFELTTYPFDPDMVWSKHFEELKEFSSLHGHTKVKKSENSILYAWVLKQKGDYRAGNLDERYVAKLKKIGFNFNFQRSYSKQVTFEDRVDQLRDFKKKYGHTTVPSRHTETAHPGLYHWLYHCKKMYHLHDESLTKEREKQLLDLGVDFTIH